MPFDYLFNFNSWVTNYAKNVFLTCQFIVLRNFPPNDDMTIL